MPKDSRKCIQCGDESYYDVAKLLVALDLYSSQKPFEHGDMIAVIRYPTPYLVNKRDPLFIYFALGYDVSLRCVLRLSTLLALGVDINLINGGLVCSEINCTFPLSLDPPDKRLPDSIFFDNNIPTIPQGVAANIKSNSSLLHYTSVEECILHNFLPCYSGIIIVIDKIYKDNISRDLEYAPR